MSTKAVTKLKQSLSRSKGSSNLENNEPKLLDIGDEAPDFVLQDEEGNAYKLSSFRGRRVILSFFRYAS
jgi:peroxiredoxin